MYALGLVFVNMVIFCAELVLFLSYLGSLGRTVYSVFKKKKEKGDQSFLVVGFSFVGLLR